MALIDMCTKSRPNVLDLDVQEVLARAGGVLRDNAACSLEFRRFLAVLPTRCLSRYIDDCLGTPFAGSGRVIQDIVNELGARLGYQVEKWLYKRRETAPGFDGMWTTDNDKYILVSVKTADYRDIRLDSVYADRERLVDSGKVSEDAVILFVTGKYDPGGLRSLIRSRGQKFEVRLSSVDSLLSLVLIKEKAQDDVLLKRIWTSLGTVQ